MIHDEFVEKFCSIIERAVYCSHKARTEGLLSLEEEIDQEKASKRDIFEYGLSFVIDGIEHEIIEKILSNIIKREKDEQLYILKNIQKEAVLEIQNGISPRVLCPLLNSFADISLNEDKIKNILEE